MSTSFSHADKRQAIYYPPTGTGRDSYIMTNNGGTNIAYRPQGVPELGNFMKFGPLNRTTKPASFGKIQKYTSDGTGRDQYVVTRHAGQVQDFRETASKLVDFRKTLRDHPEGTFDGINRVTRRNPSLSMYQTSHANRLSTPKRQAEKYDEIVQRCRRTFSQVS